MGNTTSTFGARLLEARGRAGMTQSELARAAGVPSEAAISKYEKGRLVPRSETMKRLAEVLSVSVDWLLGGESPPRRTTRAA